MNERQPQPSNPEPSPIDEVRSKEGLATVLDEIGIVSVERFSKPSRNNVFVGQDEAGKQYIIKLYLDAPDSRNKYAHTEVICYTELGEQLPFPPLVTASEEDGYLVTEFVELNDLENTKEGIDSVMDLLENKFAAISAPSLLGDSEELYEIKLPVKIRELFELGIITRDEASEARAVMEAARDKIMSGHRVFSHQDLIRENIKRGSDGNLVLIDPEFARQDVLEYDAVSLWADLAEEPELADHLARRFNESKKFDSSLFRPLAIRRCVEILRGLARRGKQDIPFGQKHSRLLKGLLAQK